MNLAHLFEAGMLVCFGVSWPLNVMKAYKARTAKGTSLPFIILIITGYVAGITAKIINNQFNYVLGVYFLNLAIVMMNIFVYIRNKALDKKAAEAKNPSVVKINIKDLAEAKEENMLNYSYSLSDIIDKTESPAGKKENKNGVILLGGNLDEEIPVSKLADDFSFNFDIYNKSANGLSVSNASEYFAENIADLKPEGMLIHLGEVDVSLFQNDSEAFDNYYLSLIENIRNTNSKCRIALVSVNNASKDKSVSLMNAHIKAIAQASKADYVNLDNVKLWNPEATKAAVDFAYNMGLKVRKPLSNVAEILYSYAYNHIKASSQETLVG